MKVISFYSYKGGVGRSLSLVSCAFHLARSGKRVVAMDLDLEAPGLHHKFFQDNALKDFEVGLVDYMYELAIQHKVPDHVRSYLVDVPFQGAGLFSGIRQIQPFSHQGSFQGQHSGGRIFLFPAGNPLVSNYWKKMDKINWSQFLYNEHKCKAELEQTVGDLGDHIGDGVRSLMLIIEQLSGLNIDYLLIDCRTGLTDLAAAVLSMINCDVIAFVTNSDEQILGLKSIISDVSGEGSAGPLSVNRKIILCLCRVPYPTVDEEEIVNSVLDRINNMCDPQKGWAEIKDVLVLHSEPDAQVNEGKFIFGNASCKLKRDYCVLFDRITDSNAGGDEMSYYKLLMEYERCLKEDDDMELYSRKYIDHLENLFHCLSIDYEAFHWEKFLAYRLLIKMYYTKKGVARINYALKNMIDSCVNLCKIRPEKYGEKIITEIELLLADILKDKSFIRDVFVNNVYPDYHRKVLDIYGILSPLNKAIYRDKRARALKEYVLIREKFQMGADYAEFVNKLVVLYKDLYVENQEYYRSDYADSLYLYSKYYFRIGGASKIIQKLSESLDHYAYLYENYQEMSRNTEYASKYVNVLNLAVDVYGSKKLDNKAIAYVNKSISILDGLKERDRSIYVPRLALALYNKANLLVRVDKLRSAMLFCNKSLNYLLPYFEERPVDWYSSMKSIYKSWKDLHVINNKIMDRVMQRKIDYLLDECEKRNIK